MTLANDRSLRVTRSVKSRKSRKFIAKLSRGETPTRLSFVVNDDGARGVVLDALCNFSTFMYRVGHVET